MATDLMASRLMVRTAAEAIDAKSKNAATLAAMAKLQATDKCFNVSDVFQLEIFHRKLKRVYEVPVKLSLFVFDTTRFATQPYNFMEGTDT